jgi:hypothetical protein
MQSILMGKLVAFHHSIQALANISYDAFGAKENEERLVPLDYDLETHGHFIMELKAAIEFARAYSMGGTIGASMEILRRLEKATLRDNRAFVLKQHAYEISHDCQALVRNIVHDLDAIKFLALNQREAVWLTPQRQDWGKRFNDAFPSASYDLERATQCMAIGAGTAAVFHTLRITEIGLNALHSCLGLPPFDKRDRSWGNILRKIESEITAHFNRDKKWPERDKFREMYAHFNSVKDAWRDSTMHVERNYDFDEAERIVAALKGLMLNISDRMNEKGEPKA